jgi:hypothetical protein
VPHKYRKFRRMGDIFRNRPQPTSKYVRWRFQCHCNWYEVRVCTEVRFSQNIVGKLGMPPNLKNVPVGQECDIFKAVQTEDISTDGHHTAQLFCT